MTENHWFSVHKQGLAAQLQRRPKGFALLELWQNAADENSTVVDITLEPSDTKGIWCLTVTDDNPDGFLDLADSYTMFKPSNKAGDATKRGRFNSGEKMVLALCESAKVISTTGTVHFKADGHREKRPGSREAGTQFVGFMPMTESEVKDAERLIHTVLVPTGRTLTFNGKVIPSREPVKRFPVKGLATEVAFKATKRNSHISLYEVLPGEKAHLYELGIPVVEDLDARWHVNVEQKVPLNGDRDNVTPAYLRAVRVAVMNNSLELLQATDTTSTWLKEAMDDPQAEVDAVRRIIELRFGKDAVRFDPSDQEANRIAASEGRLVVGPRTFTKAGWDKVKEAGALPPAGKVTPSDKAAFDPKGAPPLDPADYTAGQARMVAYTKALAKEVLGFTVKVSLAQGSGKTTEGGKWLACYANKEVKFSLTNLGKRWFESPDQVKVDELLIHEFGHHFGDHLEMSYHKALCRMAAQIRTVSITLEDF